MTGEIPLRFFSPPQLPADETSRQAAVDRIDFAGANDDPRLAAIVARAAALFGAPSAVVSIIDRDRQRWVVRHGIDGDGTSRATSFCGHTVLEPDRVLAVCDALADTRFAGNPLVTSGAIRFYAGAPLVQDDAALGALCVVDAAPHAVTEAQRTELERLAGEVAAIFEERRRPVPR